MTVCRNTTTSPGLRPLAERRTASTLAVTVSFLVLVVQSGCAATGFDSVSSLTDTTVMSSASGALSCQALVVFRGTAAFAVPAAARHAARHTAAASLDNMTPSFTLQAMECCSVGLRRHDATCLFAHARRLRAGPERPIVLCAMPFAAQAIRTRACGSPAPGRIYRAGLARLGAPARTRRPVPDTGLRKVRIVHRDAAPRFCAELASGSRRGHQNCRREGDKQKRRIATHEVLLH